MTDGWMARIDGALAQRRREQTYRERRALSGGNDRLIRDGDRQYLNFSSNDYLGLARHPAVIAAWQQGAAQADRGMSPVTVCFINGWNSGWPTGWAFRARRCLPRVSSPIRRWWGP